MRVLVSTVLLYVNAAFSQSTDLSSDVLLLSRAVRHIGQTITAVPNYTCTETIDREQKKPGIRNFQRLDMLRLEVAKTGGKELFAWPGARNFEEKPIAAFVGGGLIGDGIYGLFADDLFLNKAATMKVIGREQFQGRPAVRVNFAVHSLNSAFTITTETGSAAVDYSGSYWFDPATLNLLRLDIVADEIPLQLRLSGMRMSIDYGMMNSRGRPVTMAASSVMEMAYLSGEVHQDRIEFSRCREFSSEGNLVFNREETVDSVSADASPTGPVVLPENLTLALRLQTPIHLRTASIGDPIEARVETDVKDRHRVWLARGSPVRGRIRVLENRGQNPGYLLTGLEFSEAGNEKDAVQFLAYLVSIQPLPGVETDHRETKETRRLNQPYGVGSGGTIETTVVESFDRKLPGVGYLYLTSFEPTLPAGFRMLWKTEALRSK